MLGMRLVTRGLTMDSPTPLEPAPAAGGPGESLAAGGVSLAGQVCPVLQGGGDTYPLFPGENWESVAVATAGTMAKCGMPQAIEVLLQFGPMLLFRLVEKSKSRKVRFPQLGSRGWRQDHPIPRERTRRRRHPRKWVVPHKTVDSRRDTPEKTVSEYAHPACVI